MLIPEEDEQYHTFVSRLLLQLGENGKLQKTLLMAGILVCMGACTINFSLSFIFFDSDFECLQDDGSYEECTQDFACNEATAFKFSSDIHSLVQEHDLMCDRRWMKTWGLNIVFIFSAIAFTVIVMVMERYGRKLSFWVVIILTLTGSVLTIIPSNYWVDVVGISIMYAMAYTVLTIFYIYSTEVFNKKWRSIGNAAILLVYYFFRVVYVLINLPITDYKVNYYLMLGFALVLFPFVFFLVESPNFLYRQGDIEGLRKNLKYFNAKNNGNDKELKEENDLLIDRELDNLKEERDRIEQDKEKEEFGKDGDEERSQTQVSKQGRLEKIEKAPLFTKELTLWNYTVHITLIILTVIPLYVGDSLIETVPQKLGINDIFIASICFVGAIVISNAIMLCTLHKIKRKKGNLVIVAIIVAICILFFIFNIAKLHEKDSIRLLMFGLTVFVVGLAIAQFLIITRYVNEVFPTALRAISISLVLLFGRMSMFIGNFIDVMAEQTEYHPVIFAGILYVLTSPAYFRYVETVGTLTKD